MKEENYLNKQQFPKVKDKVKAPKHDTIRIPSPLGTSIREEGGRSKVVGKEEEVGIRVGGPPGPVSR